MPQIKLLSDKTINQIAAGEVIERPASVVKELVENSIDAGADNIVIEIENFGKNLILVNDNGTGISKEGLSIAIQRHATSKLDESDINNINYFGFRGEALPSIASVSKTTIISRIKNEENAWQLTVEGGIVQHIIPAASDFGTTVEARDLFCFTPTRLKFLKSNTSEKIAIIDLINRFALANPKITFKLLFDKKVLISTVSTLNYETRIKEILGQDFLENSISFEKVNNGVRIYGYAGSPTFNSTNSNEIFTFVNLRNIKDKLIINAIRASYVNLIPNGRYPKIIMFMEISPYEIDVNVHPTKAEIRFRDSTFIKDFITTTIRSILRKTVMASKTEVAFSNTSAIEHNRQNINFSNSKPYMLSNNTERFNTLENQQERSLTTYRSNSNLLNIYEKPSTNPKQSEYFTPKNSQMDLQESSINPLGEAICQVADTYIIAKNGTGIVIVDQHALHERLTLEKIKLQLAEGNIKTQILLVPEIVELDTLLVEKIMEHKEQLNILGFNISKNGGNQVLVREIPEIFTNISIQTLIKDLAEMLEFDESHQILNNKAEEILGEFACKNSIKAGRRLNLVEMNSLLRQLENTPLAGQCNHGRPTYIELSLNALNKMFERT